MSEGSDLRSVDGIYAQGHRFAIACASAHLALCALIASFTGTWLLWFLVGIPAVAFPAWLAWRHPSSLLSRLVMAIGFMILTGLVIQQTGGDLEAHFSFFVMMSILVVYQDWRPLMAAFLVIIVHHLVFNVLQPRVPGFYVWNYLRDGWGHLLVHACVGTIQTAALAYLAIMLQRRTALEHENAALGRSLRKETERASRDELTGLFNRRHLDRVSADAAAAVSAGTEAVTLCLIDIDHFKSVNDTLGHAAGDDVIRHVAARIAGRLSGADCAIRLGGEEFLLVLRFSDLHRGKTLAEELRSEISRRPILTNLGPVTVTASIGLAQWGRNEDFRIAFHRVDKALYAAKNNGRNRVEACSPSVPGPGPTFGQAA